MEVLCCLWVCHVVWELGLGWGAGNFYLFMRVIFNLVVKELGGSVDLVKEFDRVWVLSDLSDLKRKGGI